MIKFYYLKHNGLNRLNCMVWHQVEESEKPPNDISERKERIGKEIAGEEKKGERRECTREITKEASKHRKDKQNEKYQCSPMFKLISQVNSGILGIFRILVLY